MRTRSTRVAWGLLAVFAVGYLAVPLSFANGNVQREPGFYLALVLAFTAFMVVGAVIVAHRPGNAVGRIFSAIGLLSSAGVLTMEYAEYAYVTNPGSLPGAALAAWFSWWWLPILGLIFVFTLLLFPTGRLPSPRWRPVAVAGGLAIAAVTVLGAVQPTLKLQNEEVYLPNPVGLAGTPDPEAGALGTVLLGVLGACMVASVVSVVLRFRRSRGVERQQLKWFTYAAALMLAANVVTLTVLPEGVVSDLLFGLSIAFVPIAAGVAILRYRLYDIDRLINRTLVYAALTAVLGAVYAGAVLVLGWLFGGVGGELPSWAMAGATLAVAALFQPARRRVQAVVDRRFNRRRYDAARTVEAFSARLRDQIDLDTLSAELLAGVEQTVEPTTVSLWLRPSAARS
jgi:histidine kinase-like protein